jgi:hypothetical protein
MKTSVFLELQASMLKTLTKAQECRKTHSDWHQLEMQVMLNAVNNERGARVLSPITMQQLERVEVGARGHCDYSRKFALYCAELALGLSPQP